MTISEGTGPDAKAAGDAMLAMREWLGAETLMATFKVQGTDVDLIADEEGIEMQVDGKTVPMVDNLR